MLIRAFLSIQDTAARRRIRAVLRGLGALTRDRKANESLWQQMQGSTFDLLFADRNAIPDPLTETIAGIRALPGHPDVVVIETLKNPQERADLLAAGCLGFVSPKLGDDTLRSALAVFLRRRLDSGVLLLEKAQEDEYRLGDFVSRSPAMRHLIETAQRVAASDTTALILGETGVGKEALARALHAEGSRPGQFVAVNCAAIPETLFESELFGHTQGAFTGAVRDRRGHFEVAHNGTLFLDEVAELPSYLQVKLLRVLQERVIQPVGSEKTVDVNVRLLAATNRSPEEEIQAGRLREDLYYRLGVVLLEIPPLRNRREDIPELVENYFEIFRAKIGRRIRSIDPAVISALVHYAWPGNVRELINVMERAVLLASGDSITLADVPLEITGGAKAELGVGGATPEATPATSVPMRAARQRVVDDFERRYLTAQLRETRGRVGEAATRSGITPRALYEKMKRYGLRKEQFR